MSESIYAPKPSCPIDLGLYFCADCIERHLKEQSDIDFIIPIFGCGKVDDGMVCGETHQGFEWCEDCRTNNRIGKYHHHIGEFVRLGTVEIPE